MKQNNIIETHSLVVYPIKIVVALGKGLQETINKRYKSTEKDFDRYTIVYAEDCDAATYFLQDRKNDGFISLIWAEDPNCFTGSKMAHEATHAALDIFKTIRAEVDMNNQEPFAYLVGTIMKMINRTFYKFKDKKDVCKSPS